MADDRTEKATPKRRDEARKEGNVLRSMEINSAFAMLAAFGSLAVWGPHMWSALQSDTISRLQSLRTLGTAKFGVEETMAIFFDVTMLMVLVVAPIMGAMLVVGVLSSAIQVKPKVTPDVLKPRFKRLNPISGAKQKFGPPALFELVKNVLKMVVVGAPAGWLLWQRRHELLALGEVEPVAAALLAVDLIMSIGFRIAGIYIVIAIADYIYQRHRYEKNLRMTKHEVKQEARQAELAPELKSAQRRRQRDMARRRMLQDVPTADVVITNPTHYAVALRYDAAAGAPQVVAKGVDLLALRIREIAEEAGVMRVENRPLARELYGAVEVGHSIPPELFAAVAEVLAYVYRADGRARISSERARAGVA